MKTIELNKNEFRCLVDFLPTKLRQLLYTCEQKNETAFLLKITEEADKIRDICGERLQVVGFDEKYQLTNEGKILESLIDKFFCE